MDEKELWDKYSRLQQNRGVQLGPYYSYQLTNTPRRLLFSLARYKFAAKLIGKDKRVLELGCNEGLGAHYLSEFAASVHGVDFDETAIQWAAASLANAKLSFQCDNFLGKQYGEFDAVVSYDVVEHIYQENEDQYFQTILQNLKPAGVFLIGTPNIECEKHANPEIAGAHVNLFSGERLAETLNRHFHNVFVFTQNDEMIHTGFYPTANYLVSLCCYKKGGDSR